MIMHRLIAWFQVHFPHLYKELLHCSHSYDERNPNPYHLETDCWSHTMMVCKLAELYKYEKVVQVAALLHDIGKPASRKINPRNNHVQFFGHEEVSVTMAEEVLDLMLCEEMITREEYDEILALIRHHGILYKISELSLLIEKFNGNLLFCKHLVELVRCDTLGRFCTDGYHTDKYDLMLSKLSQPNSEAPGQNVTKPQYRMAL